MNKRILVGLSIILLLGLALYAKVENQKSSHTGSVVSQKYQAKLEKSNERAQLKKRVVEQDVISEEVITLPAGWKQFDSSVMGLRFEYPEKWGNERYYAGTALTHLNNPSENYRDKPYRVFFDGSHHRGSQHSPRIILFNQLSDLLKLTSADTFSTSYTDKDLQNHQNICDFDIRFLHPHEELVHSECIDNVLFYFSKSTRTATGSRYNLRAITYAPSGNPYYTKAIIQATFNSAYFPDEKKELTFTDYIQTYYEEEDIFSSLQDKQDNWETFENDFLYLRETLTPYEGSEASFDGMSYVAQDSLDESVVSYFENIAVGNYGAAYEMLDNPFYAYDDYLDVYPDYFRFEILATEDVEEERWYSMEWQKYNQQPQQFRVLISEKDDTLSILREEEIYGDVAIYENQEFFVIRSLREKENRVVHSIVGDEHIVDRARYGDTEKEVSNYHFRYPAFSPEGNFGYVSGVGWEWGNGIVYDLETYERLLTFDFPALAEFTEDEKYFVACSSGYSPVDEVSVYDTSDWSVVINMLEEVDSESNPVYWSECSYDTDAGVLRYEYKNDVDKKEDAEILVNEYTI